MQRRQLWLVMSLLASACLSACAVRDRGSQGPIVAYDRLLSSGDIQVAEEHLKGLGLDPGPVDGIFTEQTSAAIRQYQQRFGLPVSGVLDQATRQELLPGLDTPRDGSGWLMILGGPR
ncbi:MAG: peptidoglycan-binding domain-containing protein [Candidatus Entotheonellia bacterium]